MSLNCGGTLNALSLSPDGQAVAVAGRESMLSVFLRGLSADRVTVLKIVSIRPELKELMNLRTTSQKKANLNWSSVDVKWHPMERTFINSVLMTVAHGE